MNNTLLDYMEKRLHPGKQDGDLKKIGTAPVITISRQYGCPAKKVAGKLVLALNKVLLASEKREAWTWIGKEILEESAKSLKIHTNDVKEAVAKDGNLINDILQSFTQKYYPTEVRIKKTIADVIRLNAEKGNIVVVGRAAAAICRDIPNSLHIRLVAPKDWRIHYVSKEYQLSLDDSLKRIDDIDKKRDILLQYYLGKKYDETLFDIVFNYMTCTEDEIVEAVIKVLQTRDMM
ncbi:MAG: AAA family ATPase [Cyclobacteriaceae bacterium]